MQDVPHLFAELPEVLKLALGIAALASVVYAIVLYARWIISTQNECGVSLLGLHFWIGLAGCAVFIYGVFSETEQPASFQIGSLVFIGCLLVASSLIYKQTGKIAFSLLFPLTTVLLAILFLAAGMANAGKRERR